MNIDKSVAGLFGGGWGVFRGLAGDRWEVHHGQEVTHHAETRREAVTVMLHQYIAEGALTAAIGAGTPEFIASYREGEQTRDSGDMRRIIDVGATRLDRPFPLPLMATTTTSYGHDGAELVGVITGGTTIDGVVTLTGRFDTSDRAVEVARMVGEGVLTRHSPDLGDDSVEFECLEYVEDEWGESCVAGLFRFTGASLLGTTILPFPALDSAIISLSQSETEETVSEEPVLAGLLASAAKVEPRPSVAADPTNFVPISEWVSTDFTDPGLVGPTAPRVMPDGTYFGHLALWGQCHLGLLDGERQVCITPPNSPSGYNWFHHGAELGLADGKTVRGGVVTVETGHAAPHGLSVEQVQSHYDNTGTAAAMVCCGEDEWGIWFAGRVRPGLDDWSLWALQVASLSGDWRNISGSLELVAALTVNVPGYGIPNAASVQASGECVSLQAAGARTMGRVAEMQTPVVLPEPVQGRGLGGRVEKLEAFARRVTPMLGVLERLAVDDLSRRVGR